MNVLIIGNGLDLHLKMKTKYTDILNFTKNFKFVFMKHCLPRTISGMDTADKIKKKINNADKIMEKEDREDNEEYAEFKDYMKKLCSNYQNDKKSKDYLDYVKTFFSLSSFAFYIRGNQWLDYFLECMNQYSKEKYSKENRWIDFEQEINNVIQKLMKLEGGEQERSLICAVKRINKGEVCFKIDTDQLLYDFKRMLSAIDVYFSIYLLDGKRVASNHQKISNIKENVIKDNIDKILCFNYQNNFVDEEYFKEGHPFFTGEGICFVHGKLKFSDFVDKKAEELLAESEKTGKTISQLLFNFEQYDEFAPGIVLGIENEAIDNTLYSCYLKKNQIQKIGCDDSYKSWPEKGIPYKIYVLGHSLGIMDIEELSKLFKVKPDEIIMIYHDNKADAESKISNFINEMDKNNIDNLDDLNISYRNLH